MPCRFSTLAIVALILGSCGGESVPATGRALQSPPAIYFSTPVASHHEPAIQVVSNQFPFPVMPNWIERQGLEVHDLMRQRLSTTWLHDGDPTMQAATYRQQLSAAGYRIGPGKLSGNAEAAFTGTGPIAGHSYHFAIDFSRATGGEQQVVLLFTPCFGPCLPETSARCGALRGRT